MCLEKSNYNFRAGHSLNLVTKHRPEASSLSRYPVAFQPTRNALPMTLTPQSVTIIHLCDCVTLPNHPAFSSHSLYSISVKEHPLSLDWTIIHCFAAAGGYLSFILIKVYFVQFNPEF